MAKSQKVKQAKWLKGVNAAAQQFAQPPGSFPRDSNIVFTVRGALKTCDGSLIISAFNGAPQSPTANIGPITELALYEPIGANNQYFAIAKDFNTSIGAPTTLAAADGGGGGNLSLGTYNWVVTALDGAGGETIGSNTASFAFGVANHKANLTWTAVALATGYNVYRTVVGPTGALLRVNTTPVTTNSYTDNVADGSLGTQHPPTVDTTQVSQFYAVPVTSFGAANIVKTFPADLIPVLDGTGGGYGGGGTGTGGGGTVPPHSGNNPPTAAGGITGNVSPLPLILQFRNLMVLLLGNGIVPYTSDGTTPNTIQIVNNFQASYGSRTASTAQNVGDQISATVSGTAYIFTVVQAGTTGAGGAPAFSATEGATVVDGTVYWKNSGKVAAATVPRGAAHGVVYAGSLWLGNTSPTSTTDNFDGPSCLKMSDLNNPNSWNPLNVAFLDRDDGTQITGMATFTLAESGIPPTGSLVVFKDFSTFQINGVFGASNFSIQRAQTDMGCVAGRTVQFVPGFGIVRLTHLGIAVFDGVRDRLLSEEIRPYIFGGQPDINPIDWNFVWFSKAAQTASPPMYCCAVPLRNIVNATSPLTFTGAAQLIGGTGFPQGTYFLKVQGISADGLTITALTGEVTVSPFGIHQAIVLTMPANAGFAMWKVFIGPSAGGENQYVTFPGSQTTLQLDGTTVLFTGGVTTNFGQMSRLLCYDLVLKAWTIIDLPFSISVLKQFRTIGSIPITVMAGFSDGTIRRWQAGDATWDAGATNAGKSTTVAARVNTPAVFGKEASDRTYFRELAVRGVGTPSGLTASVTLNGQGGLVIPARVVTVSPMGGNEFTAYLDIGATGVDAEAILKWNGPLEVDSVDWLAVVKSVRGRVTV